MVVSHTVMDLMSLAKIRLFYIIDVGNVNLWNKVRI